MNPRYNDPYRCDEDEENDPYWDEMYGEDCYGADPFDDCDHEDYDFDWDGRATCNRCGHSWYLDTSDFKRMAERDKRAHEEFKREAWALWRQEWVDRICFWRRWTKKPKPVDDDDIPF